MHTEGANLMFRQGVRKPSRAVLSHEDETPFRALVPLAGETATKAQGETKTRVQANDGQSASPSPPSGSPAATHSQHTTWWHG